MVVKWYILSTVTGLLIHPLCACVRACVRACVHVRAGGRAGGQPGGQVCV